MGSLAYAASDLYRLRTDADATPAGREFLQAMKQMCQSFREVQSHRTSMLDAKDDGTGFIAVANHWGFLAPQEDPPVADAVSPTVAQGAVAELDSWAAVVAAAQGQLCDRLARQ
jgi:hypothetical protein